jgi:hypothetical protein
MAEERIDPTHAGLADRIKAFRYGIVEQNASIALRPEWLPFENRIPGCL